MKDVLAEKLLIKAMGWNLEEVDEELPQVLFLSKSKYDSYDNFMPGTRFLGSLAQWLHQFKTKEEKEKMFEFVKKKLVFISSSQMSYLISLMYNTKVIPAIVQQVAALPDVNKFSIRKIQNSEEFKKHKRMSLFIGLSDGAHMDVIRRTSGLNNEQALNNYYPDNEKVEELQKKLNETEYLSDDEKHFETVFLIDDFTASGTSFIRKKDGKYKGKLSKVFNNLFNIHSDDDGRHSNLHTLFGKKIRINILFCIATEKAIQRVENNIRQYLKDHEEDVKNLTIDWNVDCVQLLVEDVSNTILNDQDLLNVIKQDDYCNPDDYEKDSFKEGAHEKHWLGFDECALPIVLSHNTPNNSILVLWQSENEKIKSLFPRINRH